jgi:hypothetical protein
MADMAAASCADALIDGWISRYGVPAQLTSDRGTQFTSAIWDALCQQLSIQHQPTTAFHPQANGMVERCHRRLKDALRAGLAGPDWPLHLPWVLMGLRAAPGGRPRPASAAAFKRPAESWLILSSHPQPQGLVLARGPVAEQRASYLFGKSPKMCGWKIYVICHTRYFASPVLTLLLITSRSFTLLRIILPRRRVEQLCPSFTRGLPGAAATPSQRRFSTSSWSSPLGKHTVFH